MAFSPSHPHRLHETPAQLDEGDNNWAMQPAVQESLHCGRYRLRLARPLVMGILNITPDSFSDGGQHTHISHALFAAEAMLKAGVDIIDIGGESTRPGAIATPLNQELERVLPIIERLRDCGKPLSIDTYKPEVMRAALDNGADIINDVHALSIPGALEIAASSTCGLILMHMLRTPATMQSLPQYQNVIQELDAFFNERLNTLMHAGIQRQRISLDPGFGFGKNLTHNLTLLRQLSAFTHFHLPVTVGLSRKSMLGEITGKPVTQRQMASVTAAVLAAEQGAAIIRVHDVDATLDGLKVWAAIKEIAWLDNVCEKTI